MGWKSGKIPGGRAGLAVPGPQKFTLAGECSVCVEVGAPRRPLPTDVCPAFSNAAELELGVFCGVERHFPGRNASVRFLVRAGARDTREARASTEAKDRLKDGRFWGGKNWVVEPEDVQFYLLSICAL